MDIQQFILQIENGSFPLSDWNHKAHLRLVGYYVFHSNNFFDALSKTRCAIIRFGALNKSAKTCELAYHETITQFWVREVFKKNMNMCTYPVFENWLLAQDSWDKDYIYNFYSKENLADAAYRATYISY